MLIDVLGSDPDAVPEEVTTALQIRAVRQYLASLDPKERLVVENRFGLGPCDRTTQRDIARKLGISRSYVSRIEKRAVLKLLREVDPEAVTPGSERR
jgi:RNA polymerase sporulation-specific sigma factor